VNVPKNLNSGYINNTKEKYKFVFDKIFDMSTKQEAVFEEVAKEVVDSSMDGYNGTIFAYGQTGSGKTYTITGGAERMEERGIIPRTISYIFKEIKQRTSHKWKVYISYLEIYNNDGYDLLHESSGRANNLKDLPSVKIRENANKQFLLYNLSVHHVENEEEAMLLLLLGDENRVVAETPKNDASTRSHCIFMFQIESQKYGEDVKTISKLHVVDLSGSEKPYKTELNGIRMEEALNINLSLHFLEQVIVSLNKREGHIPYRNSMMTMCLRDSLGGNCKTRMIATLSAETCDIMESMSTCRFAQRVALIKNIALRNEIEDPALIIQKQKQEIEELKSELALVKGKDQKSVLDDNDLINCKKIVDDYLKDDDYSKRINLKDMLMINECFSIIKVYFKDLEKKVFALSKNNEVVLKDNINMDRYIEIENSNKKLKSEIERLKELVNRRDEEIKVLLSIIEKMKSGANTNNFNNNYSNKTLLSRIEEEDNSELNRIKNNILGNIMNFKNEMITGESELNNSKMSNSTKQNTITNNYTDKNNQNNKTTNSSNNATITTISKPPQMPLSLLQDINTANSYLSKEISITNEFLSDRTLSYNQFKKFYLKGRIIEENIKLLDEKFEKGKEISKNVAGIRQKISQIKNDVKFFI